jgi:bifunctional DNase/RNase
MSKGVIEIEVKAILPTSGGCAVFVGNDEKVFVIYVDQMVGTAISMFMRRQPKERPQTHDLIADLFTALGAKLQRVVINHFADGVYFARMIIIAENELQEQKIIEIDARPSDSIAMAVQQEAPIYIAWDVWKDVEDMTDVLEKMEGFQAPDSDE